MAFDRNYVSAANTEESLDSEVVIGINFRVKTPRAFALGVF